MTAFDRARAAWGEPNQLHGIEMMPEWIAMLARACDESSQAKVAKRIGYSPATVSYVLSGRYPGDLDAVEKAVRFVFRQQPVACPVLGAIKAEDCLAHQREPYAPHNPQRVALYRACRTCPNATRNQEKRRA